jgi:2-oxoglutarate ferredoxin oxidoreductase subunit alpha
MVRLRAAKVAASRPTSPSSRSTIQTVAETLVLGWGSTYGAIGAAARRVRAAGARSRPRTFATSIRSPGNTGEVVRA